jgi:hypothetical protein
VRKDYYILVEDREGNDFDGTLQINLTEEGIIVDVTSDNGEVEEVCAFTAQELYDKFCMHMFDSHYHTPEKVLGIPNPSGKEF